MSNRRTIIRWYITGIVGRLSRVTRPYFLVKSFILRYLKHYRIDLSDSEFELKAGVSFRDFFTRRLIAGARNINGSLVSPADSTLTSFGMNDEGRLIQAKGMNFSFNELTAASCECHPAMSYAVFYLSPADYHRFHAPLDMTIRTIQLIGGTCYPVHPKSSAKRETLYCCNERVVLSGDSPLGSFWLVFVGAMIVSSVHLTFRGDQLLLPEGQPVECNHSLQAGDEIGYFSLGSTIVLCLDSQVLSQIKIPVNGKLKMGESLIG